MGGAASVPAFKIGAKGLGEEAPRRLSGHGFSTEGREERRMSGSEFSSPGKTSVLTNPKPEPIRGRAVTGPALRKPPDNQGIWDASEGREGTEFEKMRLLIAHLRCFRDMNPGAIPNDEILVEVFQTAYGKIG